MDSKRFSGTSLLRNVTALPDAKVGLGRWTAAMDWAAQGDSMRSTNTAHVRSATGLMVLAFVLAVFAVGSLSTDAALG